MKNVQITTIIMIFMVLLAIAVTDTRCKELVLQGKVTKISGSLTAPVKVGDSITYTLDIDTTANTGIIIEDNEFKQVPNGLVKPNGKTYYYYCRVKLNKYDETLWQSCMMDTYTFYICKVVFPDSTIYRIVNKASNNTYGYWMLKSMDWEKDMFTPGHTFKLKQIVKLKTIMNAKYCIETELKVRVFNPVTKLKPYIYPIQVKKIAQIGVFSLNGRNLKQVAAPALQKIIKGRGQ